MHTLMSTNDARRLSITGVSTTTPATPPCTMRNSTINLWFQEEGECVDLTTTCVLTQLERSNCWRSQNATAITVITSIFCTAFCTVPATYTLYQNVQVLSYHIQAQSFKKCHLKKTAGKPVQFCTQFSLVVILFESFVNLVAMQNASTLTPSVRSYLSSAHV